MPGREILENHIAILLLPILILAHVSINESEASSTSKNLVNLYTHSPGDNPNTTSSNQFQNDYQHRPSSAKSTATESSHKSTTPTISESIFDPLSGDLNNAGTYDYSYQDNRGITNVPECEGRIKLNGTRGFITDGAGFYRPNLQCIWIIDSGRENATIRIQIHQFNTECNYDYLYIFDGDSIYSPLIAAFSGDMKDFSTAFTEPKYANQISYRDIRTTSNGNTSLYSTSLPNNAIIPLFSSESQPFELKAKSGQAFVYFHSDTAQTMPGFYMTYSVDSCSLDCSNRGECDYKSLTCKCNPEFYGEGCQFILCPNNCTSPAHGTCDKENSCICKEGLGGPDCSLSVNRQAWNSITYSFENVIPGRVFHEAIVVDGIMWIIGGKTHHSNTGLPSKRTSTVYSFDTITKKWSDTILYGEVGNDHLAELIEHSVAAKGTKIFIYGGMARNSTILDTLSVLDTKTSLLTSLPNGKKVKLVEEELVAPIAVAGHTANIVDGHMYIFLGFNPLYGYVNLVQKFNLANNSWSIIDHKGSYIEGCVGHTSTYDSATRLIFLHGGHHTYRSSKLFSFDPYLEYWTYLQESPSPRYYHSSVILNNQLVILGGISYNISHQSDQCYQQPYLIYDIACSKPIQEIQRLSNSSTTNCGRNCWQVIQDHEPNILKRNGHSVVNVDDKKLILFGGFNGILLNDIRAMDIGSCADFQLTDCHKPKIGLNCYWNFNKSKCEDHVVTSLNHLSSLGTECTKSELKSLHRTCESRETCSDCLSTNLGCVWCGLLPQCQYNKCKTSNSKIVLDAELCYKDEASKNPSTGVIMGNSVKDLQDSDMDVDCKRIENCFFCNSRPHCSWVNSQCIYSSPSIMTSPSISGISLGLQDELNDVYSNNPISTRTPLIANSSRFMQRFDPLNRSFLTAYTSSTVNSSPYHSCDVPCYMRKSCNECTTTRCVWCSTSAQCIDSSAYFTYFAIGQCMHYVAHMTKCSVSSCDDIETCDTCLTNPTCGWLNDISNTGKGKCLQGTSSGPSLGGDLRIMDSNNRSIATPSIFTSWFYASCPSCQCNGHSFCKPNSGSCLQPCQDNTDGPHCERCLPGFFGDPTNGGSCRPCRCNGHAQSCSRETGKCYCSTKGIIGHTCNRCDDQNHYIGDATSPNGTCYYNLTTDYQYTFNMSKSEDHFYSDINFINVPLRKDSDVDFTIACSRLALVNITSGTSYKNRKPIQTSLECGSFRLRFSHEKYILSETNYSFFVHVYKFQTPFILQIAFSQHRTLYLPQFFFTFSSCFLFFFALSGALWKLKHEYDLYVRRQRQFIEMEQMASRPFSTILLEMHKPSQERATSDKQTRSPAEPTPISFEPCFGSNIGVLSFFVQLPGRPNLGIGSALVTLNDDASTVCDDNNSSKQLEKDLNNSVQDI